MQMLDYLVLVVYFLGMAAIGLICMRLIKKQEDYFLGGRSFGKVLQTFAAFGAGTGANDPIQVGRTTWTSGLSGIWSVLLWLFVTPFYWIFAVWYRRMRHLTLGDWFVERYQSRALGAAYTIFAFAFYMVYLSTMFSAIGKVAASIIGFDEVPVPALLQFTGTSYVGLEYVLVPVIAVVVVLYGVLGGLRAAYWTDLVQGLCIIALSIVLIPYGLNLLVERFGDPSTMGMMDGFRIMHERITEDYFKIFEGPRAGEFPLHYIISLTLLALVGIVVQPHFIATGGGSAKTEMSARLGLVTGNFLKRLCTIGWALTGLIILALMADSVELAQDPDRVWGIASRTILGEIGLGLVGLMLACLLAALMSSADCYMIVTAGLVVRNIYAPYFDPNADEKTYIFAGRVASLIVIVGATVVSLCLMDVFGQFKLALEVAIVFAAPFWLGMFWRRANAWSAWLTIAFSALVFFIIPLLAPLVMPNLRTNPAFSVTNNIITTTAHRTVTAADQAKREAAISLWEAEPVGARPEPLEIGDPFEDRFTSGGKAIFWSDGVRPEGSEQLEVVSRQEEGRTVVLVQRYGGRMEGQGRFNLDFLLYQAVGMDLTTKDDALLETLRLPPRLITPFLVMILLCFLTPATSKAALDRYYVKMKTPVAPDPEEDRRELERSYQEPGRFDHKRLLPGTQLEFQKPTWADIVGFLLSFVVCFLFIGLAVWLANLGS